MSNVTAFSTIGFENALSKYLRDINRFPMLSAKEEHDLGARWQNSQDIKAAHKLVTSHLRLVAKVAMGYRGYGLPILELISEGNVGMMQAVKKFDHKKGFRLATYAIWWIKASIQEYILHSWSLVKIGTTAAQKKLFFNLRKLKNKIKAVEIGYLSSDHTKQIAEKLNVSEKDVMDMNSRMAGADYSLNAPISHEKENGEWQDWLVDKTDNQETIVAHDDELFKRKQLLTESLGILNAREKHIFCARRLSEKPNTLQDLSRRYNISRERVRQIELRAFNKIQKHLRSLARDKHMAVA